MAFIDVSADKADIHTSGFTEQDSPLFKKKLQWKLNVLLATLQCNVIVLYMDSDIVLLRDPFPYLNSYKSIDLLAQKDGTVCTGFMFLRPTHNAMQLVDVARRIRGLVDGGDQQATIDALQYMKHVRWELLPTSLFMNGRIFFDSHQYCWDRICILYECLIDI